MYSLSPSPSFQTFKMQIREQGEKKQEQDISKDIRQKKKSKTDKALTSKVSRACVWLRKMS